MEEKIIVPKLGLLGLCKKKDRIAEDIEQNTDCKLEYGCLYGLKNNMNVLKEDKKKQKNNNYEIESLEEFRRQT